MSFAAHRDPAELGELVDDRLSADYPQLSSDPVVIAVHAPAGAGAAVDRYAASVARVDGVGSVSAPQRLDAATWRIDAVVPGSPLDDTAQNAVKGIRALAPPFAVEMVGLPTSCSAVNLNAATGTFPP